jgi:NodT family efflux transporter outer membrane factor (OMF) lipoprotein
MPFAMSNAAVRRIVLAPLSLSLAAVLFGGCATRRPYSAPVAEAPQAWSAPQGPAIASDVGGLARWWRAFNDPLLTSLVERAVAGSPDVKTAISRVREARASLATTRSTLRPTVDGTGSGRSAGSESFNPADNQSRFRLSQSFNLALDASWEPDLYGGTRSAIDASAATADARQLDLRDALVSLTAEVAINYIDVRAAQRRLELTRGNVSLQDETLELTRFRTQAGLATQLDVQQALSNVENTRAQVAQLESQVRQNQHALAVLIGQPPAALNGELAVTTAIPAASLSVTVGVPAETLRRRPDVRSAERQFAAQFAQVNVARANLYPSLRLTGSIGLEALSLAKLFLPGAAFLSSGATMNTRLFNREQLRQDLVIQTERQAQAAQTYESRVLAALKDVEDTLTSLTFEQVRRDHLAAATTAAQQTADLSLQLYTSGLRDFRDVLDAQRSLLSLQDAVASSTATVSQNLVRLYKALGGGWEADGPLPTDVRVP